ncbi:MAG: histidinol dehydrogenase [Eubacteriales bacterium]|nr:histidinol dehydrogenase [Eubacteriales bacterium]
MKIIKEAKPVSEENRRDLENTVSDIVRTVREKGDQALRDYGTRFDGAYRESFRVTPEEIKEAYDKISDEDLADLKAAHANIKAFAEAQRAAVSEVKDFSPMPGLYLSHRIIPIESALCYVPGGTFPLYSSALMLITPAKVAGVKRVCAASPVEKGKTSINYKTLVAMDLAGADEIYGVGGAQAIAAFAYGTEQIKPVDLIVGPGNRYVAEAKRQCYGQIGIDFVAGPTELLIIADDHADPATIAADCLAQSEHDVNAKAVLLTNSEEFGRKVIAAVEEELSWLPTAEIAKVSWANNAQVMVFDNDDEAVEYANNFAPEHLELNTVNAEELQDRLVNYGSLFVGPNTAEVFGDYASGTNHTLPTLRAARYTGGVWVGKFLKIATSQYMTREAAAKLSPLVSRLALGEGLIGHSEAAKKRN